MAIVMRRGPYSKFDPSKLLPGEWALVTSGHPDTSDGRALYHCFAAGVVRRMLTYEEAADEMRDILDVAFEGLKDDFTASVVAATSAANSAASSASSAATSANSAAANANAEAAKVLTYVQQELAAHPEWTTTVVDGSITQKKLHPSLHGLLNAPRRTLSGEVVSSADAYPCPPRGLVVEGESVQDGTPTPDAPVPIVSVGPDSDDGVKLRCTGRNLQPFFSVTPISPDGGYWANTSSYWTPTSDGWARFTRSVTSAVNSDIAVLPQVGFEVGQTYTVLLEWRNVALTGTATMYMQADESRQLATIASTAITAGSGRAYVQTTCLHGPTDAGITRFFYWRTRLQPDSSLDGEFRLSIYKGEYAGDYEPYESVTIPIDLGGRSLRSLPDGTRDEVVVDEWGHAVLTQRVGLITITQAHAYGAYSYANLGTVGRAVMYVSTADGPAAAPVTSNNGLCTMAPWLNSYTADSIHAYVTNSGSASQVAVFAQGSTAAEVASKYVGAQFIYKRATPQTIDLGDVQLADMPGPDLTAYVVAGLTPDMELTYERDATLVIAALEAQIAEIATS